MITKLLPWLIFILVTEFVSMQKPELIDLETGTVQLNCTGTGIKWYKLVEVDKPKQIRGDEYNRYKLSNDNRTLTIEDPRKNVDEADYTCSRSSGNRTFRVRGKPEFSTFKASGHTKDMNSFNVAQDDDLHLVCEVLLRSAFKEDDVDFVWYRKFPNGVEEKITKLNISSAEDAGGSFVTKKSILSMEDVKYGDRAEYICEASNGQIKANSTVNVRVKDKLAALWPFLGIVAEVLALCTVICIYENRRGKQEFEGSDGKSPSKSPAHSK
ncbi:basigin-like [Panonychus citri]|uniref:basigin-like n=1 Tax=Panonychus citri TaxID=50023 RepID=UPI002307BB89|nr:basigin-like [Panonychus citri]XP_053214545.1 basigin-like [Panonychus citri]